MEAARKSPAKRKAPLPSTNRPTSSGSTARGPPPNAAEPRKASSPLRSARQSPLRSARDAPPPAASSSSRARVPTSAASSTAAGSSQRLGASLSGSAQRMNKSSTSKPPSPPKARPGSPPKPRGAKPVSPSAKSASARRGSPTGGAARNSSPKGGRAGDGAVAGGGEQGRRENNDYPRAGGPEDGDGVNMGPSAEDSPTGSATVETLDPSPEYQRDSARPPPGAQAEDLVHPRDLHLHDVPVQAASAGKTGQYFSAPAAGMLPREGSGIGSDQQQPLQHLGVYPVQDLSLQPPPHQGGLVVLQQQQPFLPPSARSEGEGSAPNVMCGGPNGQLVNRDVQYNPAVPLLTGGPRFINLQQAPLPGIGARTSVGGAATPGSNHPESTTGTPGRSARGGVLGQQQQFGGQAFHLQSVPNVPTHLSSGGTPKLGAKFPNSVDPTSRNYSSRGGGAAISSSSNQRFLHLSIPLDEETTHSFPPEHLQSMEMERVFERLQWCFGLRFDTSHHRLAMVYDDEEVLDYKKQVLKRFAKNVESSEEHRRGRSAMHRNVLHDLADKAFDSESLQNNALSERVKVELLAYRRALDEQELSHREKINGLQTAHAAELQKRRDLYMEELGITETKLQEKLEEQRALHEVRLNNLKETLKETQAELDRVDKLGRERKDQLEENEGKIAMLEGEKEEVEDQLRSATDEITDREQELEKLLSAQSSLQAEHAALSAEYQSLQAESQRSSQALTAEVRKLEENLNKQEAEAAREKLSLQASKEHLYQQMIDLQGEYEQTNTLLLGAKDEAKQAIQEKEGIVEKMALEKEMAVEKLRKEKEDFASFSVQQTKLGEREMQRFYDDQEKQWVSLLQQRADELKQQKSEFHAKLKLAQEKRDTDLFSEYQEEYEKTKREASELKARNSAMQSSLRGVKKELEDTKKQNQMLLMDRTDYAGKLQKALDQKRRMEEKVEELTSFLQNNTTYSEQLTASRTIGIGSSRSSAGANFRSGSAGAPVSRKAWGAGPGVGGAGTTANGAQSVAVMSSAAPSRGETPRPGQSRVVVGGGGNKNAGAPTAAQLNTTHLPPSGIQTSAQSSKQSSIPTNNPSKTSPRGSSPGGNGSSHSHQQSPVFAAAATVDQLSVPPHQGTSLSPHQGSSSSATSSANVAAAAAAVSAGLLAAAAQSGAPVLSVEQTGRPNAGSPRQPQTQLLISRPPAMPQVGLGGVTTSSTTVHPHLYHQPPFHHLHPQTHHQLQNYHTRAAGAGASAPGAGGHHQIPGQHQPQPSQQHPPQPQAGIGAMPSIINAAHRSNLKTGARPAPAPLHHLISPRMLEGAGAIVGAGGSSSQPPPSQFGSAVGSAVNSASATLTGGGAGGAVLGQMNMLTGGQKKKNMPSIVRGVSVSSRAVSGSGAPPQQAFPSAPGASILDISSITPQLEHTTPGQTPHLTPNVTAPPPAGGAAVAGVEGGRSTTSGDNSFQSLPQQHTPNNLTPNNLTNSVLNRSMFSAESDVGLGGRGGGGDAKLGALLDDRARMEALVAAKKKELAEKRRRAAAGEVVN